MKLKITVDNKVYEVEVEATETEPAGMPTYVYQGSAPRMPMAPAAAPQMAAPPVAQGPVNEEKVCRSPISGIVVKVLVQAGQKIQPGDRLLVLEAMKMETNITAPVAGTVAKVNANQGDSVQSGQVLVEFE
ncbi:MAG: acetyl-CoA carboxylase biotin carboxyl carrier protein subunit [Bryobacterales bacterium]|nr:acetyl-CoA carboxylase biotin carboxyl carrier protein subunit [Bryobacterales bacterium]